MAHWELKIGESIMLVLSRCVGEQVVLPDQAVTITVLESRGGR